MKDPHESKCSTCGNTHQPGALFCTTCGTRLVNDADRPQCPSCGVPARHGDLFCTNCGKRFEGSQAHATTSGPTSSSPKARRRIPLVVVIALLAVVVLMIYLCASGDSPLAPKVKTFQQEGVVAEGKPFIETEKTAYAPQEKIRVFFYNAPGSSRDWITVVPAGSPDRQVGPYQYMPQGSRRGIMTFDALPEGRYEVRAYYRYDTVGYKVATRFAFVVDGEMSGR